MDPSELTGFHARLSRFKKEWRVVDHPGSFRLIATGVNSEYVNPNLAASEKAPDYERSILVNFKAVEARKAPALKHAFKSEGSFVDSTGNETEDPSLADDVLLDHAYLRGLTLVYEVILRQGQEAPRLPMRGQEVTVSVEAANALDQNGDTILNVTGMQVPEPRKARSFSGLDIEDITSRSDGQEKKSATSGAPSAPVPERLPTEAVSPNGTV